MYNSKFSVNPICDLTNGKLRGSSRWVESVPWSFWLKDKTVWIWRNVDTSSDVFWSFGFLVQLKWTSWHQAGGSLHCFGSNESQGSLSTGSNTVLFTGTGSQFSWRSSCSRTSSFWEKVSFLCLFVVTGFLLAGSFLLEGFGLFKYFGQPVNILKHKNYTFKFLKFIC